MYGWTQPADATLAAALAAYPWLDATRRTSVTALEILHGVFESPTQTSAHFYLREPQPESDAVADADDARRLEALKSRLRSAGLVRIDGFSAPEVLADAVLADIWREIDGAYPAEEAPDAFARDASAHAALAAARRSFHAPRPAIECEIDRLLFDERVSNLVLTGPEGVGKTTLLARTAETARRADAGGRYEISERYVEATPQAAHLENFIDRDLEAFRRLTGAPRPPGYDAASSRDVSGVATALTDWLSAHDRRWLSVIDGLDALYADGVGLDAPELGAVQFILATSDPSQASALSSMPGVAVIDVPPLTPEEVAAFCRAHAAHRSKTLPESAVPAIAAHPAATEP